MNIRVGDKFLIDAPDNAHRFMGKMKVKVISVSRTGIVTVKAMTGNFGRTQIYADLSKDLLKEKA